jgi:hypothetical protein
MQATPTIEDNSGASSASAALRPPALKEWHSVCKAILEGEQIITLRKGGIHEEGRRFQVRHDRFLLFPTYEHQAADYLKPAYRLSAEAGVPHGSHEGLADSIRIDGFCDVAAVFEITDEDYLDALDSMHIWQKSYISDRLRWKPRQPLFVIALRAHLLAAPVEIPHSEAYTGCKSWIDLETPIPMEGETVLSNATFGAKLAALEKALG